MADKKKMKEVLYKMSSPEEREEIALLEISRVNDALEGLQEAVTGGAKAEHIISMAATLGDAVKSMKSEYARHSNASVEAFKEMQEEFLKGLKGLGSILEASKSKKTDKFYDDFSTTLLQLTGYSKKTSEIITNLKWNTWVGVKDSNGTPVNPAIAGFNTRLPYINQVAQMERLWQRSRSRIQEVTSLA
jgi:hypothetical protein